MTERGPDSIYKDEIRDPAYLARVTSLVSKIFATPAENFAQYGWLDLSVRQAEGIVFNPHWKVVPDPVDKTGTIEAAIVNIINPEDSTIFFSILGKKPDGSTPTLGSVLPRIKDPILLLPAKPDAELTYLNVSPWNGVEGKAYVMLAERLYAA